MIRPIAPRSISLLVPTGLLIPPSTTFIVYSLITNGTSIAASVRGWLHSRYPDGVWA